MSLVASQAKISLFSRERIQDPRLQYIKLLKLQVDELFPRNKVVT